ncbi:hypothetical protein CROQUDRAFT_106037 [Cronartium quercuum f. sp. fusiforme G11]|uniref:Uncharacterized protein n=1 Tax=Cronartium quercuum f. sp. fusiforme G11 TaxID=708437 RepID=A0A9P6NL33_9BASI|nr:hypothetical protein CROQUDRAFT_106037 [Cronartium quercuum f. sp. fusiforme G11]
MSATHGLAAAIGFPRTTQDWIDMRSFLYGKILVAENRVRGTETWVTFVSVGISGLLYVLCVYRALHLKKYYLVKRDSFGRLCPHSCLLVSFFGIIHATNLTANMALRYLHPSPFPVRKFIMDQFSTWILYYMAIVRAWSVWCAMPPTVIRLRESKVGSWQRHGPSVMVILLVGHFLMFALTNAPMIRLVAKIESLWAIIRFRLDEVVEQAASTEGLAPSPRNYQFESHTLLLLLKLKEDGDTFLKELILFSAGIMFFLVVLMSLFGYASIVILHALDIQLKLINDALKRAKMLEGKDLASVCGTFITSELAEPIHERGRRKLIGLKQNLSLENLAVFFRGEKLDYSFLDTPIGEQGILEQKNSLIKKSFCLRRHWWRVFLQFSFVTLCALSYFVLALCVTVNVWKIGNERYFSEVETTIDEWKTWTWISGPGIMLAAITCVAEFLDDGKAEPEPEPEPKRPESFDSTTRAGSGHPYSTRQNSIVEGGNMFPPPIHMYKQ